MSSLLEAYDSECLPHQTAYFLAHQDGESVKIAQLRDFDQFSKEGKV